MGKFRAEDAITVVALLEMGISMGVDVKEILTEDRLLKIDSFVEQLAKEHGDNEEHFLASYTNALLEVISKVDDNVASV